MGLGIQQGGSGLPVMPIGNLMKVYAWLAGAPRAVGQILVKLYQMILSPWIGFDCRYLPTCSEYANEAIGRFGLWGGGWMTCARLCRCHPLGSSGLDFVPLTLPPRARWYIPWRFGRWRGTHNPHQCQPVTPDVN